MAFFYSLLAERGININETLSSYTDTILVVAEKDVQKVTDDHIKHLDELVKAKEAEIMEV